MYQPETYGIALLLMLLSMLCWGSWANTLKLTPGWSFQLFYWDYAIGILVASAAWGVSLGSVHGGANAFLGNLQQADRSHLLLALAGGAVFNVANVLLVAAIEIAGMAVAFPVGIGLALVVGVLLNFLIAPAGSPLLLFSGVFLVVMAILVDALAYRRRETVRRGVSAKGIQISVVCGVLMGLFYPLVSKAGSGEHSLGPYAVAFVFSAGVLLCTIPVNFFMMKRSITGAAAVSFRDYFEGRPSWHLWGALGGAIWCTGAVFNFVASDARIVGPAVSYAIGQGATMISALWGVFVWREFKTAPANARRLLPLMFALFLAGLVLVAVAPLYGGRR
ncbi:L-rhamnose-proton symporter [Acidisarcina polymorpha]|uniref:L-rhamnose-proton symporter n=1 Tax=Acidisarcina polymorpha TaxID=2211140 RepID=A0A2Z5G6K2_9BACT|nr:GRP family sugar transporter [Acidisarcina polymorpha]AXC14265.1 L-rhamnose-proton symporter [Acidisarcina polymorpha]